jgi:lipoprotein-anchoring transpeptidase ErfK/SrfK
MGRLTAAVCFESRRNWEASVAFVVQSINRDAHRTGHLMAQQSAGNRRHSPRVTNALILAGALLSAPGLFASAASAQVLGYASAPQNSFPSDNVMVEPDQPALSDDGDGSGSVVPARLRRAVIAFNTREAPGTVIIDTGNTSLYYVLGQGQAIRYGVGVGREGFTWAGTQTITRKAEWPDWHPPAEMIARQPYLPRFMAGGPGNPLGARAMYLGSSEYRIHGTNDPSTIGKFVSSGCIRLTNEDVADLFSRVDVGTKVVVLPKNAPHIEARSTTIRPSVAQSRPAVTTLPSGRQAMNVSTSSLY